MDNEGNKIINEQVKKLPQEVRAALASEDLHKKIVAIGEKHHLHIDQVGSLENEVVLVMMGLASPQDLSGELVSQLALQPTDAEGVVDDVSQEIFLPIQDAMKKFTEGDGPSVVMPSAANAMTTPTAPKPPPAVPVPPTIIPPKPVTSAATTPTPVVKPVGIHAADLMLSEPTVSMPPKLATPTPGSTPAVPVPPASTAVPAPTPKTEAPKPSPYKADPYREPPE